eukprot:Nitzschia sp. Nitz4//scaffold402_size10731//6926//8110//NITZ4_009060-RA/size10731-processed-gene-0.7-mRNA-1//1//CDS//3329551076//2311//frame0
MDVTTFPSASPQYEMEPSSLSNTQEKVLILLSIVGGSLSILGSSAIVYKTLSKGFQRGPYDRLMLGLSVCDIVSSLNLALSPFMLPSATSQRVWATGNDATCSMNGWFYQFSFSATLYNGMLSYYYLLTVRFGVKRAVFAAKYEIWMHAAIWIWSLATASFGAGIGLFNELALGFGCWASDYPENCEVIDIDTCTSHLYGWAIGAVPTVLVFLSLFVNNLVIFFYVRQILAPRRELRDERAMMQATQINEVATQGYLYVGTFLLAFVPAATVRILESLNYTAQDEAQFFGFLVLTAFFQPLQGFFNAMVFNKPNYLRIRTAFPELKWYEAVREALLLSDVPRLTSTAAHEQSATKGGSRHHPGVWKAADTPNVVSGRGDEEDSVELSQHDLAYY